MFNLRSLFAFGAVVALFLGSEGRAQAQTGGVTVTVPQTGIMRDHQDHGGQQGILLTQINYADCLNEDVFTFTVNLSANFTGNGLELWAGTGCDMTSARPPSQTPTCWKVNAVTPTTINVTITATVRNILAGRTGGQNADASAGGTGGTDATGGTGGTDATGGSTDTGGTDSSSGGTAGTSPVDPNAPSACTPTSTAAGVQKVSLYFLMIDGSNVTNGSTIKELTYKLTGPAPPTDVKPGVGENIIPITWTIPANIDQTIDGYQLYCDPAPGQEGLDEAGVMPADGGLPTCTTSEVLTGGARPPDKYKCGTAAKTASLGNATGLINNVAYHVSVAATDTYRNTGVIADPVCAVPQPVTGFFEAYRAAGGEGGGGFCSFSRHGRPVLLLSVLGVGLTLMLRRRRAT